MIIILLRWVKDEKLVIRILGVVFLVSFLIYLFYSPRLKFDVLENPNKNHKTERTEQFKNTNKDIENPKPKKGRYLDWKRYQSTY